MKASTLVLLLMGCMFALSGVLIWETINGTITQIIDFRAISLVCCIAAIWGVGMLVMRWYKPTDEI